MIITIIHSKHAEEILGVISVGSDRIKLRSLQSSENGWKSKFVKKTFMNPDSKYFTFDNESTSRPQLTIITSSLN